MMDNIQQFGDDIWITDRPVAPHKDSTADDNLSYGYIIYNSGYILIHDGVEIDIPTGSTYVIDARIEHETRGEGLLIILVWDMPYYSIDKFKEELKQDIRFKWL